MSDTGAPWLLPYPLPTDLVRDGAQAIQDLAEATADGLSAAGNAGIGSNVIQTVKTDTFTTTSTSFVAVTGMTVTITPSSDTAKILLFFGGVISNSQAARLFVQLRRGSTDIANSTGGTSNQSGSSFVNVEHSQQYGIMFLDSPGVATAVTYTVRMRVSGGTGFVGRNSAVDDRGVTTLTAIEVAA